MGFKEKKEMIASLYGRFAQPIESPAHLRRSASPLPLNYGSLTDLADEVYARSSKERSPLFRFFFSLPFYSC